MLTSASGQPAAGAGRRRRGVGVVGMPVPRLGALEVSALDQDGGAGQGGQPLALRQGLGPVGRDGFLEQDGEFGEVGRDEVRQRQEGLQGGLGRFLQEPVTAGGDHHRVQDHDGGAHLFQPAADGVDHGGVAEHADLDGVDADVVADGVQLRREERRRGDVDGAHALGVLGGQGGDGGHAVAAVRRDALQVGLDPGPAGGVGAGDGQHAGNARRRAGRALVVQKMGGQELGRIRSRGQGRHPFAGANRTGSTGLDLSRPDARHPVSVFQPSRCRPDAPLTHERARARADVLLRLPGPGPAARPVEYDRTGT